MPEPSRITAGNRRLSGIVRVTRTLLDLVARYEQKPLLKALAEAEFQHDVRPADIIRVLRRGHPGSAALRAALDAHAPGHGQVKSDLEKRFRALLIRHTIELPRRNQRVGPYTVDCLWPDRRVVVELDGRQHGRPRQADTDDDRDLYLRRHRFVPRRYGTKQVDDRPDEVIANLLAAFDDAAGLGYTHQRRDGSRSRWCSEPEPIDRVVENGPGPFTIDVPEPGCWRLTLRWPGRTDSVDLRYRAGSAVPG